MNRLSFTTPNMNSELNVSAYSKLNFKIFKYKKIRIIMGKSVNMVVFALTAEFSLISNTYTTWANSQQNFPTLTNEVHSFVRSSNCGCCKLFTKPAHK